MPPSNAMLVPRRIRPIIMKISLRMGITVPVSRTRSSSAEHVIGAPRHGPGRLLLPDEHLWVLGVAFELFDLGVRRAVAEDETIDPRPRQSPLHADDVLGPVIDEQHLRRGVPDLPQKLHQLVPL